MDEPNSWKGKGVNQMKELESLPRGGAFRDPRVQAVIERAIPAAKDGKVIQFEHADLDPVLEERSLASVIRAMRELSKDKGAQLRQLEAVVPSEQTFELEESSRDGDKTTREVELYLTTAGHGNGHTESDQ
jgi:hypothetical protein